MSLPKNVVIWTLPRAGSTSLLYGIRDAMRAAELPYVHQLWEGTGAWGVLKLKNDRLLGKQIDFSKIIDNDVEISAECRHWQVGKHGVLRSVNVIGDPRTEPDNRVNILREGNWINSVVFKNMRWSPESLDRQRLNKDFDDALFASPQQFHNVVLWRRNLFDWLCSRFVFMRVGMSHGTYEWDGTTLIGDPEKFRRGKYKNQAMSVLDEFIATFDKIPKSSSIMVETGAINSMPTIAWPDSTELPIPTGAFEQKDGAMVYINTLTQKRVGPKDLVHPALIDIFRDIEAKANERFDWQNLDKNHGFKIHV